jgi:hypothetical protein
VSVSELDVVESLSLYPNPSNGQVTLQVAALSSSQLMVKITDMAGAIVWMENANVIAGNQQLELNLNQLADGLYLVQLQDENASSAMQKLMIQK